MDDLLNEDTLTEGDEFDVDDDELDPDAIGDDDELKGDDEEGADEF